MHLIRLLCLFLLGLGLGHFIARLSEESDRLRRLREFNRRTHARAERLELDRGA